MTKRRRQTMAEENKVLEQETEEKKPAKRGRKPKAVKAEETEAVKKPRTRKKKVEEVKEQEKVEEQKVEEALPEFNYRPAILKDYEILRHLVITEETQRLQMEENAMVFVVDKKATKNEIKAAVQAVFGAKVASVNTLHVRPSKRRVGRYEGKIPGYKKAIVRFDSSFDLGKIQEAVANEERQATKED